MKIPTLPELVDAVSIWLGSDGPTGRRVFFASLQTAGSYFVAMLVGLTINAYLGAAGAEVFDSGGEPVGHLGARKFGEYLDYYHQNAMGWVVTNLLVPGYRAWREGRRGVASRATDPKPTEPTLPLPKP